MSEPARRVQMVIKTSELEFDDRLRKETQSLLGLGYRVEIACALAGNRAAQGECYGGARYRSFALRSRARWPSNRFAPLHMLEFAWQLWRSGMLRRRERLLWLHDPISVLLLIVPGLLQRGQGGRIVWDQHELPPERVLRQPWLARLFGRFCNRVDMLIEANQPRLELLREKTGFGGRAVVLNNFADDTFAEQPVQPLPAELAAWLDGASFVLLQSGGYPWRRFEAVAEAVMSAQWPRGWRVILVGQVHQPTLRRLRQRFTEFGQRFYLTGMVPQMELARYLDHAEVSLVFYADTLYNQALCEANRLYQALSRGCPVVVGSNPPMKAIVEAAGAGVVLDNDGRDPASISAAVRRISREPAYRARARATRGEYRWQVQNTRIAAMLSELES